jgi:DNA-binding transcriptional LysR family regulator
MTDLLSLSCAVCVAEQKSFNAASKILGMNQSILSRRIRALEDEIGVGLFERAMQASEKQPLDENIFQIFVSF